MRKTKSEVGSEVKSSAIQLPHLAQLENLLLELDLVELGHVLQGTLMSVLQVAQLLLVALLHPLKFHLQLLVLLVLQHQLLVVGGF